jgi:hypothetical protein
MTFREALSGRRAALQTEEARAIARLYDARAAAAAAKAQIERLRGALGLVEELLAAATPGPAPEAMNGSGAPAPPEETP